MDPANQKCVSLRVGFPRGSVLRYVLLRIALVVCGVVCMLAFARIAWFVANPVALAMVTIGELALALALGVFPALALVAWRLQTKHFATDLAHDPAHEPYQLEQPVELPAQREAAKQASCFELGPRLAGVGSDCAEEAVMPTVQIEHKPMPVAPMPVANVSASAPARSHGHAVHLGAQGPERAADRQAPKRAVRLAARPVGRAVNDATHWAPAQNTPAVDAPSLPRTALESQAVEHEARERRVLESQVCKGHALDEVVFEFFPETRQPVRPAIHEPIDEPIDEPVVEPIDEQRVNAIAAAFDHLLEWSLSRQMERLLEAVQVELPPRSGSQHVAGVITPAMNSTKVVPHLAHRSRHDPAAATHTGQDNTFSVGSVCLHTEVFGELFSSGIPVLPELAATDRAILDAQDRHEASGSVKTTAMAKRIEPMLIRPRTDA